MINVGDIVMMMDADDESSIPAYQSMRGMVKWVSPDGQSLKVAWFDKNTKHRLGDDEYPRRVNTVKLEAV